MNVFLQVLDPDAFSGQAAFTAESSWLADACRNNPPRPGVERLRLPGEQALVRQHQAQAEGVPLAPKVVDALRHCSQAAGLAMPAPVG